MISENSRMVYTRYWLTGVNQLDEKWYATGNPTFFCLPESMEDKLYWIGDNMYETVSSNTLHEDISQEDIVKFILNSYTQKIRILKNKVYKGKVICTFKLCRVNL